MVGVMILLFMILALLLVSVLNQGKGGDVGTDSQQGLGLAWRRAKVLGAQTLAESGVRMSLQWLMQQSTAPSKLTAFAPSSVSNFFGGTTVSGWTEVTLNQGPTITENPDVSAVPGKIRVRFYPYASNATSNRKMFGIEAVGEYQGMSHTVRVFVRQNSFARYAYFSDTAPTGWWVSGSTRFQGPVHVNGVDASGTAVDSNAHINILWKADDWSNPYSDDYIFTYPDEGYFTTSMDYSQLNWQYTDGTSAFAYDPNWWTPYWEHITAAGRAPKTNQPLIRMPSATTDQKSAALGTATEPASTFVGAFIPVTGSTPNAGIYVGGNVKDLNLTYQYMAGSPGHDDQVFEIIQGISTGEQLSRIVVCLVNNTVDLTVSTRPNASSAWTLVSSSHYAGGATNGVIYVNGHIGSQVAPYSGGLSGTVVPNIMSGTTVSKPNTWTIVTEGTKTININGGIVYKNLITDSSNPSNLKSNAASAPTESGTLGLVAGRFRVPLYDDTGATLDYLTVHAVVMAYDTFEVTNYSTRAPGVINLLGGFIVKNNSSLGVVQLNGTVNNGFILNRNYDQRIADNPPPNYPVADRSYQVMSFQKVNTSLN